jgi:hypothetical protein
VEIIGLFVSQGLLKGSIVDAEAERLPASLGMHKFINLRGLLDGIQMGRDRQSLQV